MWVNATHQLDALLPLLWRASWQAALLTIVVLLLQWILKDKLPARWRYNLWLIVLLRLLLPVLPESPISIYNLFAASPPPAIVPDPTLSDPIAFYEIPAEILNDAAFFPPEALPAAPEHAHALDAGPLPSIVNPAPATVVALKPFPWRATLAGLWFLGLLFMLARMLIATLKLHRLARRLDRITDPAVTRLLDSCKRTMHVRHPVTLLASDDIPAPALMGFFNPKLLLPANLLTDFDPRELRLILMHELAHVRRRDVAVNWLATLLHALHWFNPVLWLAMARMRTDRELATDELVLLAAGHADDRQLYGQTILKLLQTLSRGAVLPGVVGILERTHPMRRRITMIAQFTDDNTVRRSRSRWSALALAAGLALGAVTLTGPVRGQAAGDAHEQHAVEATLQADGNPPAAAQDPNADPSASPRERLRERRVRELGAGGGAAGGGRGGSGAGQPGGYGAGGRGAYPEAGIGSPYGRGGGPQAPLGEEDAEMRAILGRKLPEVNFDNVAFADAIDFLRDVTGANIFVNWRALEAVGIDRQTPVSMRMRNVAFGTMLRLLLESTAPGLLRHDTDGGVIVITTTPDAQVHIAPATGMPAMPGMMGGMAMGGGGGGFPPGGAPAPGMGAAPGAVPSAVTRVYDVRDLLASAGGAAPDDAQAINALRNQIGQVRAEIERNSERLGADHPERQRLNATELALVQRLAASGAGADPGARTARLNELVGIVQATIGSEQPLNVLGFNTKLIVRAAPETQAEVQNLLTMLRDDKQHDTPSRSTLQAK